VAKEPKPMLEINEDKTAFNARAKASMREFLRSKTWEEKVESIERMNAVDRLAKDSMSKALVEERMEKR
jgi:hypothetical protein